MKNVAQREFSSAFRRLYGYIAVGILLLVSAILFTVYNLVYTTESISTVCAGMSVVSALVIPVVALGAFPSRRKADTDCVYGMMPLCSRDVVLGKFLASLAVVYIPNAVMIMYPVFIGFFGNADHLVSYTNLLALCLFEAAWLAVCMFIAKVSRSRVIAAVICYALAVAWYFLEIVSVLIPTLKIASLIGFAVVIAIVCVGLWLATRRVSVTVSVCAWLSGALALAFALIPERFVGLFEAFLNKLSIFARFNAFTLGVFDIESIIFFLALTAVFIFLTYRAYEQKYEQKPSHPVLSLKKVTSAGLATLIVASALALSCAAAVLPDKYTAYDTTLSKRNSVTDEAKAFLGGLDREVTLYLLEPTGMEDYELYLEKLVASSDNLKLKRVYYADDPNFYIDRDINTESISANSLVVECGDRYNYLSYYNLFVYSNEKLGVKEMSYSEYAYYRSMYAQYASQSEQYMQTYYSLLYDTTVYFIADRVLCMYIEYTSAEIIPTNYYLTGHGEKDLATASNPYAELGLTELDASAGDIPEDAASVLINMPDTDITDAERDGLIAYLARGGQITVITNEANLDHENLCAVLAEYGLSARKGSVCVKETVAAEEGEESITETVTEFVPIIATDNDVLYYLDGVSDFSPTVKNANAISVDTQAQPDLTVIPLLMSDETSFIDGSQPASYTLACAVETPNGSRIAWFTGGEAFNIAGHDSANAVICALNWVTLKYESEVSDVPAVIYTLPTEEITSGGAGLLKVILIAAPIAVAVVGAVVFYSRKRVK